jgi:hypothetical protein
MADIWRTRIVRNPERIDPILEEVRKLWKQNPDLRFTQLVANITALGATKGPDITGFYFIEDDTFEWLLGKYGE